MRGAVLYYEKYLNLSSARYSTLLIGRGETKEENPPGWRCGSVETCRNGMKCLRPEAVHCGGRTVTAK